MSPKIRQIQRAVNRENRAHHRRSYSPARTIYDQSRAGAAATPPGAPYAWYVAETGASPAAWTDETANGLDLTAAGAPTVNAGDLNGLATVSLDGANDGYFAASVSDWAFMHNGGGCSYLVVYFPDATAIRARVLSTLQVGSSSERGHEWYWSPAGGTPSSGVQIATLLSVSSNRAGWLRTTSPIAGANAWHYMSVRADSANATCADKLRVLTDDWIGNPWSAGIEPVNCNAPAIGNPPAPLQIGQLGNGGERFKGKIAEVVIYDTLLSNDDLDLLHAYAVARYAL